MGCENHTSACYASFTFLYFYAIYLLMESLAQWSEHCVSFLINILYMNFEECFLVFFFFFGFILTQQPQFELKVLFRCKDIVLVLVDFFSLRLYCLCCYCWSFFTLHILFQCCLTLISCWMLDLLCLGFMHQTLFFLSLSVFCVHLQINQHNTDFVYFDYK